mgnify:CR=1 FL=1
MPGHTFDCPITVTDFAKLPALVDFEKVSLTLPVSDAPGALMVEHRLHTHLIGWAYCANCDLYRPPGDHACRPLASHKHAMQVDEPSPANEPPKKQQASTSYAAAAAAEVAALSFTT